MRPETQSSRGPEGSRCSGESFGLPCSAPRLRKSESEARTSRPNGSGGLRELKDFAPGIWSKEDSSRGSGDSLAPAQAHEARRDPLLLPGEERRRRVRSAGKARRADCVFLTSREESSLFPRRGSRLARTALPPRRGFLPGEGETPSRERRRFPLEEGSEGPAPGSGWPSLSRRLSPLAELLYGHDHPESQGDAERLGGQEERGDEVPAHQRRGGPDGEGDERVQAQ